MFLHFLWKTRYVFLKRVGTLAISNLNLFQYTDFWTFYLCNQDIDITLVRLEHFFTLPIPSSLSFDPFNISEKKKTKKIFHLTYPVHTYIFLSYWTIFLKFWKETDYTFEEINTPMDLIYDFTPLNSAAASPAGTPRSGRHDSYLVWSQEPISLTENSSDAFMTLLTDVFKSDDLNENLVGPSPKKREERPRLRFLRYPPYFHLQSLEMRAKRRRRKTKKKKQKTSTDVADATTLLVVRAFRVPEVDQGKPVNVPSRRPRQVIVQSSEDVREDWTISSRRSRVRSSMKVCNVVRTRLVFFKQQSIAFTTCVRKLRIFPRSLIFPRWERKLTLSLLEAKETVCCIRTSPCLQMIPWEAVPLMIFFW